MVVPWQHLPQNSNQNLSAEKYQTQSSKLHTIVLTRATLRSFWGWLLSISTGVSSSRRSSEIESLVCATAPSRRQLSHMSHKRSRTRTCARSYQSKSSWITQKWQKYCCTHRDLQRERGKNERGPTSCASTPIIHSCYCLGYAVSYHTPCTNDARTA